MEQQDGRRCDPHRDQPRPLWQGIQELHDRPHDATRRFLRAGRDADDERGWYEIADDPGVERRNAEDGIMIERRDKETKEDLEWFSR